MSFTEFIDEDVALTWFGELGYSVGLGLHSHQMRNMLSWPRLLSRC